MYLESMKKGFAVRSHAEYMLVEYRDRSNRVAYAEKECAWRNVEKWVENCESMEGRFTVRDLQRLKSLTQLLGRPQAGGGAKPTHRNPFHVHSTLDQICTQGSLRT